MVDKDGKTALGFEFPEPVAVPVPEKEIVKAAAKKKRAATKPARKPALKRPSPTGPKVRADDRTS